MTFKLAPSFEVHDFEGKKSYSFDEFQKHKFSVLIFWSTYCEECLLAFESTWEKKEIFEQLSVNVISINTNDTYDVTDAIIYARDSPFPVYFDKDGIIAKQYQATYNDFFAYIINRNGEILYFLDESLQSAGDEILKNLLFLKNQNYSSTNYITNPEEENVNQIKQALPNTIISGFGRIRFMNIKPGSYTARGAYGERLSEGSTLKFYFEPQVDFVFYKNLQIGTIIRMTNISDQYLLGSPDYFTNNIFSPYLNYRITSGLSTTMGFYKTFFSPLILMRWDEDDNPPGMGGIEGGCRICEGLPGGISTENLEDLNPEIGFEGILFNGNLNHYINGKILYARPNVTNSMCTIYQQHVLGFQLKNHFLGRNFITINYLNIHEDAGHCETSAFPIVKEPLKNDHLVSADLNLVLLKLFDLSGEFAYIKRELAPADTGSYTPNKISEGTAYLLQCKTEFNLFKNYKISASSAYIFLDKDYDALYRALSYIPNRRGIRFRSEISNNNSGLLFFYKSMKEIEILSTDDTKLSVTTKGLGCYKKTKLKNLPLRIYIYYSTEKSNNRDKILDNSYLERSVLSAGISIQLNKKLSFLLSCKNIWEKYDPSTINSRLISAYTFVKF